MAWIDHRPYPNTEFGTGDFQHDSGQWLPAYMPLEAQRILAQKQSQDLPPALTDANTAVPDTMPQDQGTAPEAPAPELAPAPKPAPPPELPQGATRLKDAEATTDMRKRSMDIVNNTKDYPMGSVVPMGDGLFGRVEQHTWTNKEGKRVPGHFRGVTLYRGPEPTSQETPEEGGVSYPGDLEQGPPAAPVSKADVTTSTNPEAVTAKNSPWSPEELAAIGDLNKSFPNLTAPGLAKTFGHESGLNPSVVNPKSGAAGLFQLMPDQAKELAPDKDITKLSRADQIRLYGDYLKSHHAPEDVTDADLGLLQAAPSFIGKPDDTLVYKAGSKEAEDNKPWQNKDGSVTVGSIKAFYGSEGPGTTSTAATPGQPTPLNLADADQVTQGQTTTNTAGEHVVKGIQDTPEAQAMRQQGVNQYAVNVASAALPVMQARQAQINAVQEQALNLQKQLEQRSKDEAEAQTYYKKTITDVNDAKQAVLDDKEPPPFGGNVLAGILAAFAQGAGAYAAAINHTSNFAADTINAGLARDSARWKQQHLDKAYNVKDAQELRGDARLAFEKASAQRSLLQNQYLETIFKQNAEHIQGAQEQQAAQLLIANVQKNAADDDAKLQRLAQDQVQLTKQGTTTNTQQTKEKSGGADISKYVNGSKDNPGRRAIDEQKYALTNKLAPALGFDYDPETDKFSLPKNFQDKLVRNPITGAAASQGWQNLGHPLNWLNEHMPGVSPEAAAAAHADTEASNKAYAALQTVMNEELHKAYGARITGTEIARKRIEFEGMDPESQVAELNNMLRGMQNQKEILRAAYPGAEQEYERRRENDVGNKPPVSFTPGVK